MARPRPTAAPPPREYELTERDFQRARGLARRLAGIDLGEAKRSLVYGRLARRLRALGLERFSDYLALVESPSSDEAADFVNAITTNVTEFFRERHHFDYLAQKVLFELRRAPPPGRRVRLWSAGCSTGEEAYCLAMVVRDVFPDTTGWDIRILATDIDSDVLAFADSGVYPANRVERIPATYLTKCWQPCLVGGQRHYEVKPAIRRLVTFKQLNLHEPWPMQGPFDVIFCRNVVIYFDAATKSALIRRFHDILAADGRLFLGHSESLVSLGLGFASVGQTAYRKVHAPRDTSALSL